MNEEGWEKFPDTKPKQDGLYFITFEMINTFDMIIAEWDFDKWFERYNGEDITDYVTAFNTAYSMPEPYHKPEPVKNRFEVRVLEESEYYYEIEVDESEDEYEVARDALSHEQPNDSWSTRMVVRKVTKK